MKREDSIFFYLIGLTIGSVAYGIQVSSTSTGFIVFGVGLMFIGLFELVRGK